MSFAQKYATLLSLQSTAITTHAEPHVKTMILDTRERAATQMLAMLDTVAPNVADSLVEEAERELSRQEADFIAQKLKHKSRLMEREAHAAQIGEAQTQTA